MQRKQEILRDLAKDFSKDLKQAEYAIVQRRIEALRFYEALKIAQQSIEYDSGRKDLNDIVLSIEELRDYFLKSYLLYLTGEESETVV